MTSLQSHSHTRSTSSLSSASVSSSVSVPPRKGTRLHKQQLKKQLRQFYGLDESASAPQAQHQRTHSSASSVSESSDAHSSWSVQSSAPAPQPHIMDFASSNFNPQLYLHKLLQTSSLSALLKTTKSISHQIQHLDANLQKLVYENYNKFLRATTVVKEMRACVEEMEGEMRLLEHRMTHMMSSAELIEQALNERTQNIQRLTAIALMLKKMQFVLDLPLRLAQCLELGTFDVAVKYYHVGSQMLSHWTHHMKHANQTSATHTNTPPQTLTSFESIWDDTQKILTKLKEKLRSNIDNFYENLLDQHLRATLPVSQSPVEDSEKPSASSQEDSSNDTAPLEITYRRLSEHFSLLLQLNEPHNALLDYFLEQHMKHLFDPLLTRFSYQPQLTISQNLLTLNQQFFSSFQRFFELFQDIFFNATHGQEQSSNKSSSSTVSSVLPQCHASLVSFTNSLFERYFDHVHNVLVTKYNLSIENSPKHDIHNDNMTRDLFEAWESMAASIKPIIRLTKLEEEQFAPHGSTLSYEIRTRAKQQLKETVFHFIQHNKEVLTQKIDSGLHTLSLYKQSKNQLSQQFENENTASTAEQSHLKTLAQNEASRISTLVSQFILHFRQFVDGKEPLIKSSISLFQDRLYSNIFSLVEHVAESTLIDMCSVFSEVLISERDIRCKTTPSGALILSALCRTLSTKSLRQIEQTLTDRSVPGSTGASMVGTSSGSLKSASSSSASSANAQLRQYQQAFHKLRTSLQHLSRQYILYYIEKQGLALSELVKLGMETPQWTKYDVPREVRHMTTVIVQDTEQIATELDNVLPDEFNHSESSSDSRSIVSKTKSSLAYGKHSTASALGGSTLSHHRAGSVHDFMNVLESDVMKIFNKKLSSFTIGLPESQDEISRTSILFEICKIVVKTLEECVRAQVFNRNGFQQIQVDVTFLRRRWKALLPEKHEELMNRIQQGVLQSAAENATECVPLDEGIVEKIVDETEQRRD